MPISFIGWFGILLGFSAMFVLSGRKWTWDKLAFVFVLAMFQTAVGVYFYFYALENSSDAALYYFDEYDFYQRGFGLSTQFLIWLVQSLKAQVGGSYLDYFLLFQAAGTWGAVFIMKTFQEVFQEANVAQPNFVLLVLLLPGIHFWTAFIGKDGLLFLAASIAGWAAINIQRRWIAFSVALGLMLLCRPHIALLGMTSIMAAILFDNRSQPLTKVVFGTMAAVGTVFAALTVQSTLGLDLGNVDAVSDFIQRQSKIGEILESTTNITNASFPVKLFSLLFRPLFFDAGGSLPALIASVENLLLLIFFGYLIYRGKLLMTLIKRIFYVRYAAIFATLVILLLSLVHYNVGLGLRQKMMVMPALMLIFAAMVAAERLRGPSPRRVPVRA